MKRTFILSTLVGSFLFLALTSCQHSPRKNYFLLSAPSVSPQKSSSENIDTVIGIGPVVIADYLDRSPIVYMQSNNTMAVSDNDFWGEPLDNGIARVLAANLMQRNNARSFVNFPWRADNKPNYNLRVNIRSLNRNNSEASIDATWELVDPNTKTTLQRRNFIRSTSTGSDSSSLAQSYSALLSELAGEMDNALSKAKQEKPQ